MEKNEVTLDLDEIKFPEIYWTDNDNVWIQPPVDIKHGDLVDVDGEGKYGFGQTFLGRYIGKGMGIVEFYNYATGITYHIGKVRSRGYNKNPRLISDENLLKFIKD
jgi:hypothetical protein